MSLPIPGLEPALAARTPHDERLQCGSLGHLTGKLVDIISGLKRLKDPARFAAWAYRIVSNKAHDGNHQRNREGGCQAEVVEGRSGVTELDRQERATDVHEMLRRLSTPSQVVLTLYYPEGTVKSRLHSARIEFKNCWEALGTRVTT